MASKHNFRPRLVPVVRGQTIVVNLDVRNYADGTDIDWTGRTVTCTITPQNGTPFSPTVALAVDPSVPPQATVTITPGETTGLAAPQILSGVVFADDLAGDIDAVRFELPLVLDK